MAVLVFVCQEHGKWRLEERRKAERRKGVKEGMMQEGGADACEGVVQCWSVPVGVPCVGVSVWRGWVCCQRVCFSLSFSEMAVLVFVCQEHGKWRLEKRRKAERRKGVKEGRGGYACFEGVVHVGMSPCWGALCWGACGCPCVGKTLL